MVRQLRKYWMEQPLLFVMIAAIFFRLLSVIFAKGWGMIDDHFIVIESAQSWVDGQDYNDWLPGSPSNTGPTGHSFFYPGVNFLLFSFCKIIGLHDPQLKMLLVRFLNAMWSLITVWFGYKITERLSDKSSAKMVGLLLAILWFMPWISVRNLVEVVCNPLLVLAIWFIISREGEQGPFAVYFLSGLFLGLAFNIRPQTVFFTFGVGLVVLIQQKWKGLFALILGTSLPIILIQGTIDYFIWGRPFVEIYHYFFGNFEDANAYINLPWYDYFLVVLGILVPPVSIFLFFGYLRNWRKIFIIFLPVAVFFFFHSIFPNKQERFILPVIPFIVISGVIGWNEFVRDSSFWQQRKKLLKACWTFFWVINLAMLPLVSTIYSKRARVESMYYLSRYHDIEKFLVVDSEDSPDLFPRFYLGQWPKVYDEFLKDENTDAMVIRVGRLSPEKHPRFILFTGEKSLQEQVIKARKSFPFIVYETTIEPGMIDKVMHWLNPVNKNRKVTIYRNTVFFPEKNGIR